MATRCVQLRIHGRVQGVFYRARARATATGLGLRGWVRNLDDGTVEAMACGPGEAIEQFIGWCGQGPTAAHVGRVEVRELPADETLDKSFDVRS